MGSMQDLKTSIWYRTFNNEDIQYTDHYYRLIAESINNMIKTLDLGRSDLHWHTVRNFFTDRSQPQPATLDLLATYAAGTGQAITYHQYLSDDLPVISGNTTLLPGTPGKWRVKVTLEVPIILEFEHLPFPLAGRQQEE